MAAFDDIPGLISGVADAAPSLASLGESSARAAEAADRTAARAERAGPFLLMGAIALAAILALALRR